MRNVLQVIFLTAGVACWQMLYKFVEEADTRFVINLGRYILEHGFPHVDPFTIHEGLKLVPQQWLSGVLFWEAYKNFGLNGLLVVDYVVGAAAVIIFWRLCLLMSNGNKNLSFALAFAVGLIIVPAIVPRPHIISAALLVGEVFLLEKFTRTGEGKFLLPLLPLSTLLSNFHAAMWAMSLVICLPFLFVKNFRHVKFLLAAMAGIFLCGLINPYGLDAMTYVLRSYGVDLINLVIPEMRTPSAHGLRGKIFYATEALIIFSLGKCNVPWRYIFLSGGIIYLSVMHLRNSMLFYLIATAPLAYAWRNFAPEKFFTRTDDRKVRALLTAAFILLLSVDTVMITVTLQEFGNLSAPIKIFFAIILLFTLYTLLVAKAQGRILHPTILPRKNLSLLIVALITCVIIITTTDEEKKNPPDTYTRAIEFILRSERPENISLYVPQGIGGLAGSYGIRYYIDSRSEVFLDANNGKKNILEEYINFSDGKIYYRDFLARYNFTHIILTTETPFLFDELSRDKNFRVIYESERVDGSKVLRCKVFVPKES